VIRSLLNAELAEEVRAPIDDAGCVGRTGEDDGRQRHVVARRPIELRVTARLEEDRDVIADRRNSASPGSLPAGPRGL
jgi:hypothetical protein